MGTINSSNGKEEQHGLVNWTFIKASRDPKLKFNRISQQTINTTDVSDEIQTRIDNNIEKYFEKNKTVIENDLDYYIQDDIDISK